MADLNELAIAPSLAASFKQVQLRPTQQFR